MSGSGMNKLQQAAALEAEACMCAVRGHHLMAEGNCMLAEACTMLSGTPALLATRRAARRAGYIKIAQGHEECARAQELHVAVGRLRQEAMAALAPGMQKSADWANENLPDAAEEEVERD